MSDLDLKKMYWAVYFDKFAGTSRLTNEIYKFEEEDSFINGFDSAFGVFGTLQLNLSTHSYVGVYGSHCNLIHWHATRLFIIIIKNNIMIIAVEKSVC